MTAAGQLGNTTEGLDKFYLHTDEKRGAVAGDKFAAVLGPVFGDPGSEHTKDNGKVASSPFV